MEERRLPRVATQNPDGSSNERCVARAMVEEAWAELDPLVPDSQAKVALRAFAWYLLERHTERGARDPGSTPPRRFAMSRW